ncbi:MAG TPA: PKD domain-containing protein [Thermoleophilaceae bacterium]|jgi:hypothetical protein
MSAPLATLLRRGVALMALVVLALAAVPAAASAEHNPKGRFLGVVKSKRAGVSPFAPRRAPVDNVTWHGGPVVHASTAYAIFWAPPGHSFPADYTSSIADFFTDVAADSGKSTNVFSVARQYADGVGPAAYQLSYGGSFTDTDPFPASDCVDPGTSVCLTDQQLTAELDGFIAAQGLPRGMSHLYFLFTPAGVGSCYDSSSSVCAFQYFCGYHSDFLTGSGRVLYANEPYASGVWGCDDGEYPTGTSGDGTINVVSHEQLEIATDPLGNAWYDSEGEEIADKCGFDFGVPLGVTPSGANYNQLIAGSEYWLQQEWSNSAGGCVQSSAGSGAAQSPVAAFTHGGSHVAGQLVTFDGTQSHDPDGTILGYEWDYGDGATGTGRLPFHAYPAAGTYTVKLTVTDNDGATGSASAPVAIGPAATAPTEAKPVVATTTPTKPAAKKKRAKCRKAKSKKGKKKYKKCKKKSKKRRR